ncbi:hypothetical protein LCL87_24985 [Rhodococcus hoagii]|nr:hypothetical protein [Prescottella equi]
MTDTITPASTFTAEEWRAGERIARANGFVGEADHYAAQAARLEAESARDEEAERLANEEAERLAKVMWSANPRGRAWESLSAESREIKVACARAGLDRLAADGRLLPEGGTVLTEEQVANLRWLMAQYVGFDGDIDCPPYASLDALFTPPAVSVPDSGPDGTPEKPWPTWQDVPEGVKYRSRDEHGDVIGNWWWWNQKGIRYTENECGHPRASKTSEERMTNHYAPFVRVDGDKA